MTQTDEMNVSVPSAPSVGFVGFVPPPPPPPAPPVNFLQSTPIFLPHQEVQLVLKRENLPEIAARSVSMTFMSKENIWTRPVLPNLRIKQKFFDEHYSSSETTVCATRSRRSSVSTSFLFGWNSTGVNSIGSTSINDENLLSFVLLDATSKMLYDVPMRHLIQLVKKDFDDDATIDHVIRAIDQIQMKSEWLDAVIALNKQFDKRPEDKKRVLAHQGPTDGLVLIEQFFVKLVRVPAYDLKLIFLKFREETPSQLERMSKHLQDLLETIETILTNEQLPGILHLLCLLFNNITGKQIAGLHFESLLSLLSTRTAKQKTTIANFLCQLLEEQYPNLLTIFDNTNLSKLKDLSTIKYVPIFVDIRAFFNRYKQIHSALKTYEDQHVRLPEHFRSTLNELQHVFQRLFDDETKLKHGEKCLSTYFCHEDLSVEKCFVTLSQFIEKLRSAQIQNVEERRRNEFYLRQQRSTNSIRTNSIQFASETNIFRDHFNFPLTPISARQREKLHRTRNERNSISSRDVSHSNDDEEEFAENSLTRKREHSPSSKTILNKRTLNTLGKNDNDETDEVFISMDFAETSAVVPTKTLIPISYERSDQQIKSKGEIDKENVKSNSLELTCCYSNLFHHLWRSTLVKNSSKTRH